MATDIFPGDDLAAIVAASGTGSTFLLKTGTHRLHSVAPKNNQVFLAESGAIMSGARLLTSWATAGSAWVTTGQTQEGTVHGDCIVGYGRCNRPEELFIDGVRQRHVTSIGAVGAGSWFFDYAADNIYIGTDPSGKTVETSITTFAFQNTGNNVTLQDLTIQMYASPAQYGAVNAEDRSGWVVADSTLTLNHGGGLRIGHSMQALRNRVSYNGQIGIVGVGDDVLIEDNEIDHNNDAFFDFGWEGGGTKFVLTKRLMVRGNNVHHNRGPGLWSDIDNINSTYDSNTVEDNFGDAALSAGAIGILIEISYATIIKNNIVRRNGYPFVTWIWGAGILVAASANVEIYGNTVEENGGGILAVQQSRGSGIYGEHLVQNLWVHNNAVQNNDNFSGGLVQDVGSTAPFLTRNNRWDGNDYLIVPGSRSFAWNNSSLTFTEWQAEDMDTGEGSSEGEGTGTTAPVGVPDAKECGSSPGTPSSPDPDVPDPDPYKPPPDMLIMCEGEGLVPIGGAGVAGSDNWAS